jgi:hypothetical protein
MRYRIGMLILVLISYTQIYAQYPARVELQFANFFSPHFNNDRPFSTPVKALGIGFSYKLHYNLGIKIGYQRWVNPFGASIVGTPFEMVVWDNHSAVQTRNNYNIFDVSGIVSNFRKRHEVFADAGISYASGKNEVLTSVYQEPGYPDKLFYTEMQNANYAGVKYEFGYNYLLFKKRMNTGVSFSGRNYSGTNAFDQYNLNINVGYNFNFLKTGKKSH